MRNTTPTHILVIEDNAEVRENLAEILALSGYQVLEAANGKEGVERAVSHIPNLILCDVMMPELDGYGVLRILSQRPETSAIPFIFLTAKTEKEDLRRGMNLGADDYLTKPIYKDELLQVIEKRLEKADRLRHSPTAQGGYESFTAFVNEARGHAELKKLSTEQRVRAYARRETIFIEGDHPRYLYLVKSGKIKLYKSNDFGKEFIIEYRQAGDFFGYTALIESNAYNFAAEAMEDSEVYLLVREDFLQLLYANRDVAAQLVKMLAQNVGNKEAQLLQLAYNSIRKRVADTLLAIRTKEGTDDFDFLRDDLAKMVGTAKESVIRTLSDFKQSGYIDIQDGHIYLLDIKKLQDIPG